MKRFCCTCLFFVFSLLFLSAGRFEDYKAPENWIPNHVTLMQGNDNINLGLSINQDDQKSYSEHLLVEAPLWNFSLDLNGITNRGWREGWSVTDSSIESYAPLVSGRYDATVLLFGFPYSSLVNDRFYFRLYPQFGLTIAGNHGLDFLQNFIHSMTDIKTVEIDYETEGNRVYPNLDVSLTLALNLIPLERTFLYCGTSLYSKNILGFSHIFQSFAELGIASLDKRVIMASVGYTWSKALSGWKTQDVYYQYLKGLTLNFEINSGFLRFLYSTSLDTMFGYGKVGIDVLSLFDRKETTWKHSDVLFSFGKTKMLDKNFLTFSLSVPMEDPHWSVVLNNRVASGNAVSKEYELSSDLSVYPRYRKAYAGIYVGGRYSCFPDSFISPFSEISVGLMSWRIKTLRNMIDQGEGPFVFAENFDNIFSFSMDAVLGLDIVPEGMLVSSESSLSFSIYFGFTFIHNPEKLEDYMFEITKQRKEIGYLIPRWGISGTAGFDI